MVEIKHDRLRGYYTLYIDGEFEGNYDTISEAREDANYILNLKALEKEVAAGLWDHLMDCAS